MMMIMMMMMMQALPPPAAAHLAAGGAGAARGAGEGGQVPRPRALDSSRAGDHLPSSYILLSPGLVCLVFYCFCLNFHPVTLLPL